jgi:hypothetical protein
MKGLIHAHNEQSVSAGAILEASCSRKRYRLDAIGENKTVRVQRIGEDGKLKPKEIYPIEFFGLIEVEKS